METEFDKTSASTLYDGLKQWFVMRDLKRSNAKCPAYQMLTDMGIRVFTPMIWKLYTRQGKRVRKQVPFMQDLLFVFEQRKVLDAIVERISTLQYRFVRGAYHEPMTVLRADMDAFIRAVESSENPQYYSPGELTPAMVGKKVRIIGGALDGYEGFLRKVRGSKMIHLLVELPSHLTASIEVEPEFVEFI